VLSATLHNRVNPYSPSIFGTFIGEVRKCSEIVDFLTRKRGFFANEVALRPKNAQNERLCNLLRINNKTF
jgi:hypothetical protein